MVQKKDYVIAGGGNTSFKNDTDIWVKAAELPWEILPWKDLPCLHRNRLQEMYTKQYSKETDKREARG